MPLFGVWFRTQLAQKNTFCIEPPQGVTLPCQEQWQVLVTQVLGGTIIEFQIIKKSQLDTKTHLRYHRDLNRRPLGQRVKTGRLNILIV